MLDALLNIIAPNVDPPRRSHETIKKFLIRSLGQRPVEGNVNTYELLQHLFRGRLVQGEAALQALGNTVPIANKDHFATLYADIYMWNLHEAIPDDEEDVLKDFTTDLLDAIGKHETLKLLFTMRLWELVHRAAPTTPGASGTPSAPPAQNYPPRERATLASMSRSMSWSSSGDSDMEREFPQLGERRTRLARSMMDQYPRVFER